MNLIDPEIKSKLSFGLGLKELSCLLYLHIFEQLFPSYLSTSSLSFIFVQIFSNLFMVLYPPFFDGLVCMYLNNSSLLTSPHPLVAFAPASTSLSPHQTEPSRLELVIVANYKGDSRGPVKQNRSLSIQQRPFSQNTLLLKYIVIRH